MLVYQRVTINNRWFQISMNRYNHLGISENGGYNKLAISEREINSINCWSTILFDIFGQAIHGPFIPHFVAMFWLTRAARNHGGCGSTSQISVGGWFSHSKSQPFTQNSSAQKYLVNSLIHIPHVVALIDLQLDSGLSGFTTLKTCHRWGIRAGTASEQATEKPETGCQEYAANHGLQ